MKKIKSLYGQSDCQNRSLELNRDNPALKCCNLANSQACMPKCKEKELWPE